MIAIKAVVDLFIPLFPRSWRERVDAFFAKSTLKRRYEYLIEVDHIMEEFVTDSILSGGSEEFKAESRKKLLNLQNDIKSKERLLEFIERK